MKALHLWLTIAAVLLAAITFAHPNYQCSYAGQLYSEGAEVVMDGGTKQCTCNVDGDKCGWF